MLRSAHPTSVDHVLAELLGQLTTARLDHALVRDPSRDGRGQLEVDLLVAPAQRARVETVLAASAFRRRPSWGRRPHRSHLRPVAGEQPDGADGGLDWIKVDLVTDLCFGPWHELTTEIAVRCLAAPGRPPGRLAPADELAALLLHGLLDRGSLTGAQRHRLQALAPLAGAPAALAAWCAPVDGGWPTWPDLVATVAAGDWDRLDAAIPELRRRLVAGRPASVSRRALVSRTVRHCVKPLTLVAGRGPLVALVGPDGTGKTTLARSVAEACPVPGRVLYGGTYRNGGGTSRFPGGVTARVAGRLLVTRGRIAWHRGRGRLVVLDRHPAEARATSGDTLGPKARLRRRLLAATLPRPDLLLALDAPAALLHERRPEHDVAHLERDRLRHLELVARTPGAEVVDATESADAVRDRTVALVWDHVIGRGA